MEVVVRSSHCANFSAFVELNYTLVLLLCLPSNYPTISLSEAEAGDVSQWVIS